MEQKKRQHQSFEYGAAILVVATMLVKVIGAVFKIPLSSLIGTLGFGYFTSAYDLFLPIYSLAMAGLPIAISRMVAENVAKKQFNDVKQTLRISRIAFLVSGAVGFVIMAIATVVFFNITGDGRTLPSILVIAPSILFCCVMSVYRGYYEGMRNMTPTAVSNVIEALGKLILGLGFAFLVIKIRGDLTPETASLAAAGAMLGITVGTALGALYLVIKFKKDNGLISAEEYDASPLAKSGKQTLKILITIAIPIALGSLAQNVASLIDVTMVKGLIADDAEIVKGIYSSLIGSEISTDADVANFLYGVRGQAFTLFNLIPTITSVMGVSALPVLATSWTNGDRAEVKKNMSSIIKLTSLIALPAGVGLAFLGGPVMSLIYGTEEAVLIGGPMLTVFGVAAVFSGLAMPLTNMLQAIGKQIVPVINIAIGAVVKIVVNFILVGNPEINILGSAIGTLCCYLYIAIANFICLVKFTKTMPNLVSGFVKPLVSALCCGMSALGVTVLLNGGKIPTILGVAVAAMVYFVVLILLRGIDKEDVCAFPKGEKISKILEKLHIIR